MTIFKKLSHIAANDLTAWSPTIKARGPAFLPEVNEGLVNSSPLSFIVGEHPSEYSVSPLMWNIESRLLQSRGLFLPIDIPHDREHDLIGLLDLAFEMGKEHFRVLTITNPYKVAALAYFREKARTNLGRIEIEADALAIGATNQVLIGPDNVFHVINSDGRGMANAIQNHLMSAGKSGLKDQTVALIGAGGAARGIAYELVRKASYGRGRVTIFNRTVEKANALVKELNVFFPGVALAGRGLDALRAEAATYSVIVGAVTDGDPLFEQNVYPELQAGTLIVDANYGANSLLVSHAEMQASDRGLIVRDGSGMVVEGYIIPSTQLAKLWGYTVSSDIYRAVGAFFGYKPSW